MDPLQILRGLRAARPITKESEYLSVVLEPGWLDSGNIVIFWGPSSSRCEVGRSFHSYRIQQKFIFLL